MFMDANFSQERGSQRDDDGAKRVFFGGERFLEGISGQAYVMNLIFQVDFYIELSHVILEHLDSCGVHITYCILTL